MWLCTMNVVSTAIRRNSRVHNRIVVDGNDTSNEFSNKIYAECNEAEAELNEAEAEFNGAEAEFN